MSGSVLENLSVALNASEAALRLLISILLGFPFAFFHRYYLYGKSPVRQHLFFIVCGLTIGYWNYGWNILHSATSLCATYLVFLLFGGTSLSVIVTLIINMVYLLSGYYLTSTDDYDIKWTMPQCVLTLRLIGLAFNLWDGQKPKEKLSILQEKVALKKIPSILEIAAFTYFPASFLVGPQYSMKRYLDYVNGCLLDHNSKEKSTELPDCVAAGISRAGIGLIYLISHQLGTMYVSDQYLLSPEFLEHNIFKRLFLIGFWGHANLYKYISCWLLTEGVCIAFGLTYNGEDEHGQPLWNGCENVRLLTFEKATKFNHYILSFNINTNNWCAEYIYKRLRFLGSKLYSQFATLLFLAVWHGFHSGYYVCFFLEFIIMYAERDMAEILERIGALQRVLKAYPFLQVLIRICMKIYTFSFMGYCLVCFVLLSFNRYHQVYSAVYYSGHVIYLTYPFFSIMIKRFFIKRSPRKAE